MEYVASLGQDVTINMCVNEHSYRALPHYRELLEKYGVRQLHIDQVRPSDAGDRTLEYFKEIMPRYSEMAPYFARMLERIDEWDSDYDVNLGNYPYCQLPEWAHKIHHDGQKTFTYPADGHGNFCDPFDKYPTKRHDKSHAPGCKGCVFKKQCNGVFDTYVEMYGVDEFQAVTKERLRELDEALHFFVILVDEYVRGFFNASPPEPWEKVELFRNTRDRVIEVRFVDPNQRRATLVLTPPVGRGKAIDVHPPILRTNHFQMSLFLDDGIPTADTAELIRWAERELTSHEAVDAHESVDYERLLWGLVSPERLRRGRARVVRLANTLKSRGPFGSWFFEGSRPLPGGRGLAVTIAHEKSGSLELVLELQPDDTKPLVGVRYSFSDDVEESEALPAVQAVLAALRG